MDDATSAQADCRRAVAPAAAIGADLAKREMEVPALLAKAISNPEIAERLVIGRATDKVHVSNILSKMGVASRAEAVSLAIDNKLAKQASLA